MAMKLVSMIHFTDADAGEEALLIVRAGEGMIALTLSLQSDGGVEVFFGPGECERLHAALQQAAEIARAE